MSEKEKETSITENEAVDTSAVPTEEEAAANPEAVEVPEEAAPVEKASEEPTVQIYFQYSGTELAANALVEQVKNIWADLKKGPITSLDLYIKPEDMAAYYVVNDEHTGKINL